MIIEQLFDGFDEIVSQPKMNGARPNESEVLIIRRFEGVGDLALALSYVERRAEPASDR